MDSSKKIYIIFDYLRRNKQHYASYQTLCKLCDNEDINMLLTELLREGRLIYKNGLYAINYACSYEGVISLNKNGIKVIKVNGKKEIPLTIQSACHYLEGDTVKYRPYKNEAVAYELVKRRNDTKVFQVVLENNKKTLRCTSYEYYLKFDTEILNNYNVGEYLLIKIDDENNVKEIIKRLPSEGDIPLRERIISLNHGFEDDYSEKYYQELKEINDVVTEDEKKGRIDYTNKLTYSIDNDDTRDMDDAISIDKLDNGHYLLIGYISAISEYVNFDGEIFNKAMSRGTSQYNPYSVFHMFHPVLSQGICSLKENEIRLVKSIAIEIDENGYIVNKKIEKSFIKPCKNMKYSETEKVFRKKNNISEDYLPYVDNLQLLLEAAKIMDKNLKDNRKIEMAQTKWRIKDSNQAITDENPISRKVIEVCMLYINIAWSQILKENNIPMIYRVEEKPDEDFLNQTISRIRAMGYYIPLLDEDSRIDKILDYFKDRKDDYYIISNILLRTLKPAMFSNKNSGHYALNLDLYAQHSAPIRMFAQTVNHYSTDYFLENDSDGLLKVQNLIDNITCKLNERCEEAELAERENLRDALLDIALNNINNVYEGIVEFKQQSNIYVRLENGVYGILDCNNLDMSIGCHVYAQIKSVNYDKKTVSLRLIKSLTYSENENVKNVKKKIKKR